MNTTLSRTAQPSTPAVFRPHIVRDANARREACGFTRREIRSLVAEMLG